MLIRYRHQVSVDGRLLVSLSFLEQFAIMVEVFDIPDKVILRLLALNRVHFDYRLQPYTEHGANHVRLAGALGMDVLIEIIHLSQVLRPRAGLRIEYYLTSACCPFRTNHDSA